MTTKPNRNDPCPCGSGKKYRHCHGDPALKRGVPLWVYVSVGVVALVGVAFYLTRRQPPAAQGTQPTPFSATPAGPASATDPAPYTYDSTRRQHWDPAHRHWHDGPPPSSAPNAAPASPPFGTITPAAPPAAPSATTPEPAPYFYRASTDEFWDPTHKHWHKGKPPVATPSLTDTIRR